MRIVDAAAQQAMATVRGLVKQRVNVNATRPDGSTALLWVSHWDDSVTAALLIQAGANPSAANDYGVTPLALAAENASIRMVETLLKGRADPNRAQASGMTPLMIAAKTGSAPVVAALLASGARVNNKTVTNATALMWAAEGESQDVVKLLVAAGADIHAFSDNGFSALMYAAQNGDVEMSRILIDAGVSPNEASKEGTHALPLAILRGHDELAMFFLEHGADPNGTLGGIAALHTAAARVDLWLSDWNMTHDRGRREGRLPPSSRLRLVKALLARGADPNVRAISSGVLMSYLGYPRRGAFESFSLGTGDLRGATPLWMAANSVSGNQLQLTEHSPKMETEGFEDIIHALLEGGADQGITTADGTTPLMVAAGLGGCTFIPNAPRGHRQTNAEEAVKMLVERGADVNAKNEADFTALHGATFRGLNEIIQYLVEKGADINSRDFRGRTPYRLAEGAKQSFQFQAYPETAELLKNLGANTRLGLPGLLQERAAFYDGPDDSETATQPK